MRVVFPQIKHISAAIKFYMSILESSLKMQNSWQSSSFRVPFQEQQLPTPLVMKNAVILLCSQTGILRLCSHMWAHTSKLWRLGRLPGVTIPTQYSSSSMDANKKHEMVYSVLELWLWGPLTTILPSKTTTLVNHPKSLTPIHKNTYPFTKNHIMLIHA